MFSKKFVPLSLICAMLPMVLSHAQEPLNIPAAFWNSSVRVIAGNSCGSGSICGHDDDKTYVLSNAHVTGTRPGTSVRIQHKTGTFAGRVIMSAYSNRTLADWSIIRTARINAPARKLSIEPPQAPHHVTVGSPGCIWPQSGQRLRTVNVAATRTLWQWQPNARSGQSGSGVWQEADGLQYGLLTWSWNGNGAGQQTYWIRRQQTSQAIDGPHKQKGMIELVDKRQKTEEGFHAETGITDLPIWEDSGTSKNPDCEKPSENDVLTQLRRVSKERNIDYVALITLIIEILKLFGVT